MYLDFIELVKNRQACRDFNDLPLEKELVEKIVEVARLTPSACNSQPWKMYCVTSDDAVSRVKDALTCDGRNLYLKNAKAFIVLGEKATTLKEDVLKKFSIDYFVKYDIGELIAYITLTAKSLGVESLIVGWLDHEKLKQIINFSDGEDCSIVIALGYSNSPLREKNRRKEEDVIEFI